jgi:serine/threonine protein kinase
VVESAPLLQSGSEPFPGYSLRQLLGRGGFAEVWEAQAPDGRVVALKFLASRNVKATPSEIRSLQAIRQVRHPNLVEVFNVWCQPGFLVVAMERAECSLADLVDVYRDELGTALPPQHVCFLLAEAAEALDFLNAPQHTINGRRVAIHHCDVKPSNLLLFGEKVKLTDFGLTALGSCAEGSRVAGGTWEYAAPEVFRGHLSKHSDQYALAVSYFQLRTGRLPFAGARAGPPRANADLSGLLPRELPVVARALSPEPYRRWPSCAEFINQLSWVFA